MGHPQPIDTFTAQRERRILRLQTRPIPDRWVPSEARVRDWYDLGTKVGGLVLVALAVSLALSQLHKAGWL